MTKKVHHHRKTEMEHHKKREEHKRASHHKKEKEYAHHEAMIDNRKVKDNHQQGISRVLQRKGDLEVGQHGKMK